MNNDPVKERVLKCISGIVGIPQSELNLEATMRNMRADSLDYLELALDLEDEFKLEISDSDLFKLKTIQQFVDYIEMRMLNTTT